MAAAKQPAEQKDLTITALVLSGMLLVGIWTLIASGVDPISVVILWALGCAVTGFIGGFLFGFPRVITDNDRVAPAPPVDPAKPGETPKARRADTFAHRLAVNTNLEQISDWLTKIIVGVGLVELKNVPAYVARAGRYVGAGFKAPDGSSSERIAAVILVLFGGLGLLAGYLLTRMFFSAAFRRADERAGGATTGGQGTVRGTPLEEDGMKISLAPAAKAATANLALAPKESVDSTPEKLADWARVQFDAGHYKDAAAGYRDAIKLAPSNAALRHAYAIALKYAGADLQKCAAELQEALDLARQTADPEVRRQVYVSYTFNHLYLPPPDGYTKAREAALEYVSRPDNLPSGDVFLNLACAYGQQASHEGAQANVADLRAKALVAVQSALSVTPRLQPRVQQMLEGRAPGDDDLQAFAQDPEFRRVAGLAP